MAAPPSRRPSILGHPHGLAYLAFTETWERFSYYGMTALLSLYMIEAAAAAGACRACRRPRRAAALFELRGPMSNVAFASLIYGWYGGLVYFTPVLGGLDRGPLARHPSHRCSRRAADERWPSRDGLRPEFPHRAAAADRRFGLASRAISRRRSGSSIRRDEESRRTRGFTIFSAAINIGAVLGPLGCGTVAAIYGWHAGSDWPRR